MQGKSRVIDGLLLWPGWRGKSGFTNQQSRPVPEPSACNYKPSKARTRPSTTPA